MPETYRNQAESGQEMELNNLIKELASSMHENWRNRRKDKNGVFESRIKTTNDEAWISAHNGQTEVDIANTSFADLPLDWKEENLASAKVAIEKLRDVVYLVHDFWLDRNSQSASPEQQKRYSMLPPEEKAKDLEILDEAVGIMKQHL
jgi:hypothetical protein